MALEIGPDFLIGFPEGSIPDETIQEINRRRLSFEFVDHDKKMDRVKLGFVNDDRFLLDSPVFRKGTVMTVTWGYPNRMAPSRSLVVTKSESWNPFMIEAKSPAIIMTRDKISWHYENLTISEIVTQIAERHGFRGESLHIEDTQEKVDINQARESDATFINRLAYKTGKIFYIAPDGLHWEERNLGQRFLRVIRYGDTKLDRGDVIGTPTIKDNLLGLASGVRIACENENLDTSDKTVNRDGLARINELSENRDFNTVLSTIASTHAAAVNSVSSYGRAIGDIGRTLITGAKPERNITGIETDFDVDGRPRERGKSKFLRGQNLTGKMNITIIGDPLISAKSVVVLEGFSKSYDGSWWVKGATHKISSSGYTTDLELVRDGHQGRLGKGDSRYDLGKVSGGRPGQRTRGRGDDGGESSSGGDLIGIRLAILKQATLSRSLGLTNIALIALDNRVRFVQTEWGQSGVAALPRIRSLVRDVKRVGRIRNDPALIQLGEELLQATESIQPIEDESRARINTSDPIKDLAFGTGDIEQTQDSEGRPALSYRPRGARIER